MQRSEEWFRQRAPAEPSVRADPALEGSTFSGWEADDVLEVIRGDGLSIHSVVSARWPADAPQPRSHRQAMTFLGGGAQDPHLLLIFDNPQGLETWRLWLSRYVGARPYLAVMDNVLLLVSRDLPLDRAAAYHRALERLQA